MFVIFGPLALAGAIGFVAAFDILFSFLSLCCSEVSASLCLCLYVRSGLLIPRGGVLRVVPIDVDSPLVLFAHLLDHPQLSGSSRRLWRATFLHFRR